ncbi:MAG: D-2-hydroxyacid dehydrogenase [Chloroflexi bacterium]|nr:MAG: D-2-hydroxyacid dehydrogenase [Chloroflexota bacterium]
MAQLRTLGVTVDVGEARLQRVRDAFPDLEILVELDLAKAPQALAGVDAIVGRGAHVNLLANSRNLRWVQTLTAGSDAVSFDELAKRNVVLTNGSGIHAINVAEHLVSLLLAFARALPALFRAQQRHQWFRNTDQFELYGQTACVVGLGDIGQAFAERAAALGMRVTGVRRRELPTPACITQVATLDTMDPLLAEADHIVICLPLTQRTGNIFNADRLALLKPSAYIYNIGRGELIDQEALIAALRNGRLAGAGLDVTTPEPLPPDNPLWDMDNVIITAHSSGGSPTRMDRFVDLLIDNITRYRNDQPLRNVVDPVEGY